jgi:hypothetical protein
MEVRRYEEVGLAEVGEGGDDGDRVRNEMYQLDVIEEEKAVEEVTRRDPEPKLDMREEDDGLAGPLCLELLTRRRPPTDLRLGPQQSVGRQGLDLTFVVVDGSETVCSSRIGAFSIFPSLKPVDLALKHYQGLGSHARLRRW